MPDLNSIFPPTQRVVYRKNPLREVICQLRFPTILRITSEIPSTFQEKIRGEFPDYVEETNAVLPASLPPQILQILGSSTMSKRHRFTTRNGAMSALLDGQNLTLTASPYIDWETFSGSVYPTIEALIEVYSPTFLSRIGLRYQNQISAPSNDPDFSWGSYLRSELVGVLGHNEWQDQIFEHQSLIRCNLDHAGDRLLLQYGLQPGSENPALFNLDFDYYFEQETEPKDARAIINRLHGYSGRAFRWAITKELHDVLDPQSPG